MSVPNLTAVQQLQAWYLEQRREPDPHVGTPPTAARAGCYVLANTLHTFLIGAQLPVRETVDACEQAGWVALFRSRECGGQCRTAAWYVIKPAVLEAGPAPAAAAPAPAAVASPADPPKKELSPTKQAMVNAVRDAAKRLTQTEILNALSKKGMVVNQSTISNYGAELVKDDVLTNGKDKYGRGYGLPEWTS